MTNENNIIKLCEFIQSQRGAGSTTLAVKALLYTGKGILIVPDRATKQFVVKNSRRQIKVKTFQEIAENRGGVDSETPYLLDNSAAEQLVSRAIGYARLFDENMVLRNDVNNSLETITYLQIQNKILYNECSLYLPIIRFLNKIFRRKIQ